MSQLIHGEGKRLVASSGTPVSIEAVDTNINVIVISALSTNTGKIWIGTSTVSASGKTGIPLSSGNTATIPAKQLNDIYIDAEVSGEGVSYYWQAN